MESSDNPIVKSSVSQMERRSRSLTAQLDVLDRSGITFVRQLPIRRELSLLQRRLGEHRQQYCVEYALAVGL